MFNFTLYILPDYFTAVVLHVESPESSISITRELSEMQFQCHPRPQNGMENPQTGAQQCVY